MMRFILISTHLHLTTGLEAFELMREQWRFAASGPRSIGRHVHQHPSRSQAVGSAKYHGTHNEIENKRTNHAHFNDTFNYLLQ
jgi:hypothetical protein